MYAIRSYYAPPYIDGRRPRRPVPPDGGSRRIRIQVVIKQVGAGRAAHLPRLESSRIAARTDVDDHVAFQILVASYNFV